MSDENTVVDVYQGYPVGNYAAGGLLRRRHDGCKCPVCGCNTVWFS